MALALLLVSRTVKDEGALSKAGGPSLFVDLLEDDDACIRHAAATFLEVGPTDPNPHPNCKTTLQGAIQKASFFATCKRRLQVAGKASLSASTLGWGDHGSMEFSVLHVRVLGVAFDQLCSCLSPLS